MKRLFLFLAACVAVVAPLFAQLRIVSFKSSDEIVAWINPPVARAFYSVESADSPAGSWNKAAIVADLDYSHERLTQSADVREG